MSRNEQCKVCGDLALWVSAEASYYCDKCKNTYKTFTNETYYYCDKCKPPTAKFVLTHKCVMENCDALVETNPHKNVTGLYCDMHDDTPQKKKLPLCEVANCPCHVAFRFIGKHPTRCGSHNLKGQVLTDTGCCEVNECKYYTDSTKDKLCKFHLMLQSEELSPSEKLALTEMYKNLEKSDF